MINSYDEVYENVYEEKRYENSYENSYDNIYILRGSMEEEQAKKEMENIKKYFKNTEVYEKVNDQNGYLGKKKLAYSIKENEYGYYYLTHFRANAEEIPKIEMNLKLNDDVMKFITIKAED